jgi:hypothetical protein
MEKSFEGKRSAGNDRTFAARSVFAMAAYAAVQFEPPRTIFSISLRHTGAAFRQQKESEYSRQQAKQPFFSRQHVISTWSSLILESLVLSPSYYLFYAVAEFFQRKVSCIYE